MMMETISDKDQEYDINYAEQQTRWILTLLGIWPSVVSNPTRIMTYASKFWLPCPPLTILMILIPILCHVALRDLSYDEVVAMVGPIFYPATNVLKNCILISRRGTIKFCMQHMKTDWRRIENQHERDIMLRNLEVGRGLTRTIVLGMFSTAVLANIKPLFSPTYVNSLNQSVRPLPYPGADVFVDLRHGFNYEIVYISSCVCIFFLHVVVTAVCNLAALYVSHACGQIQIVMSRLDALVDNEKTASNVRIAHDRIVFIVRNHIRVLRFSSTVDTFLQEICLIEVACSTLVICWAEYNCMMVWLNRDFLGLVTDFLVFICLSFNLFIYCHIGELLKEQWQQIGKVSCMIDWYRLPGKTGHALVLIIIMSNYPCKLTAGRIMELSYHSFGNIIRTSLAYLNILRSMME